MKRTEKKNNKRFGKKVIRLYYDRYVPNGAKYELREKEYTSLIIKSTSTVINYLNNENYLLNNVFPKEVKNIVLLYLGFGNPVFRWAHFPGEQLLQKAN